jgi:hypothetical protein
MSSPKPPQPPRGAPISLDSEGILRVNQWRAPARGATVQTVDGTGKRITATRLFLTGPFALAMKKKTGALSVVVCGADGDSRTVKCQRSSGFFHVRWQRTAVSAPPGSLGDHRASSTVGASGVVREYAWDRMSVYHGRSHDEGPAESRWRRPRAGRHSGNRSRCCGRARRSQPARAPRSAGATTALAPLSRRTRC